MRTKRLLLPAAISLFLCMASSANVMAQRPCAAALGQCAVGCTSQFSGLLQGACIGGCSIGYLYCVSGS
ncbi:MAG TPA: hypothetical protein VEO56_11110 [Bacteroidota bacterium]|nr:hypothetical protein [Bacteroidota bacterium]